MQGITGKRAFFGVGLIAAIVAMNAFAFAEGVKDEGKSPIAAKVNGRVIYLKQLELNVSKAAAKYRKYSSGVLPEQVRKRMQREELERQVGVELLVQAGERSLSADAEKKIEEKLKTQQARASTESQAGKNSSGDKGDESSQKLRRQLLVDEYLAKRGVQQLQVPETEQKNYYEQNLESFRESESVKVSHILIALPRNPKPEELAKAEEKIEMIRGELAKGKDFSILAKEYSACATAKAGGDLGYINHGYMPHEFDKIAFLLKSGEISDVVKTKYGLHLIKAFDKKPSRIQTFAEVKPLIEKFLLKKFRARKIEEIVKELSHDAQIEISLN